MFDDYREIPLKIFLKVLADENRLSELLPDVKKEEWESYKDKFQEDNPTPEEDVRVQRQQKVLYPDAKIQMYGMLIKFCLYCPEKWESLFDEAGVQKKETMLESIANVNKMIKKETVRFNIAQAEFKQFLEDMKEKGEDESDSSIFDVISSLSSVTGNRLDYNTATIGELLAEQKLAKRITDKHRENGG